MDNFIDFSVLQGGYSVVEYCTQMERKEIIVNHNYQRSDKVWPIMAKSFLIETLILGYPMPKLALRQLTDLSTKKHFKEIVDGQQRSEAIYEFYTGQLQLSQKLETVEMQGCRYAELPDEYKQRFLDYHINTDTFTGADDLQVREMFRRMNTYTVPLNPEEQRHAVYQGPFKWFAHSLGKKFGANFVNAGLFTDKQLIRMADTKLITEVSHAYFNAIQTTNKAKLDNLYKGFNARFTDEEELTMRFTKGLDDLFSMKELWGTSAMKPFMAYALLLALMHIRSPMQKLQSIYKVAGGAKVDELVAVSNISALIDEFDNKEDNEETRLYPEFVLASDKGTNVKAKRETRFRYFCMALLGDMDATQSSA